MARWQSSDVQETLKGKTPQINTATLYLQSRCYWFYLLIPEAVRRSAHTWQITKVTPMNSKYQVQSQAQAELCCVCWWEPQANLYLSCKITSPNCPSMRTGTSLKSQRTSSLVLWLQRISPWTAVQHQALRYRREQQKHFGPWLMWKQRSGGATTPGLFLIEEKWRF